MAGIQIKRFNWVKHRSTYEQNRIWNAKRRAMREDFETINTLAASAFSTAQNNLTSGMSELAAMASIKRSQDALAATRSLINKLV
jgi:hypothetical protein